MQDKQTLRTYLPVLGVSGIAVALVIFKWHDLALPAFWDEGFPYMYAVRYMHDHGLSLLPSSMPPLYSTGHPTLFYFLSASWMKIFGTDVFSAHLFPLLVSVLLLFAVYSFGKKFGNAWIGAGAALLVATRTIFLTQSSFLLPENLVALFTILTLQAWLEKKQWRYFIWGSLLLLTKEPGIVLIAVLGAIDLFEVFRLKETTPAKIRKLAISASPLLLFITFFIVQKIQMGWFFFPRHMNFFAGNSQPYLSELIKGFGSQFFVYYGGVFSSALLVVSGIALLTRKSKLNAELKRLICVVVFFTIAYLLFSSFSFPIPRYLLCLYGPWFVMVLLVARESLRNAAKWIMPAIVFVIALAQLGYAYDIRTVGDSDLGFRNVVDVQRRTINWVVEHAGKNEKIYAGEQYIRAMSSDADGFVSPQEVFTNVTHTYDSATTLFIFTAIDEDETDRAARQSDLVSVATIESGNVKAEIFAPRKPIR